MRRSTIAAAFVGISLAATARAEQGTSECYIATYQLAGGELVDVAPSENDELRWRTLDGKTGRLVRQGQQWTSRLGWTTEPDNVRISFGQCGSGEISFNGRPGRAVALESVETQFQSQGVTLAGRLVLPTGQRPVPVVVLGHGSERTSALTGAFRQRLYAAAGVGVFVYDKRGTGKSTGRYTQDFEVLATDAAAAMAEARRLAPPRSSRFGYLGGSQAGWVLPLAARKVPAEFVIVGYGIAAGPLVEDRTETLQDLVNAGWNGDVLKHAREVTDATGAVIASRFTTGLAELRAVAAKYQSEPWFKDLDGEFTGEIVKALKYPDEALRAEGQRRDEGTTWNFDAVGSLRQLEAPLLWMIAGDDTGGAGPETLENLSALQQQGRPITIAVFPDTEHGIHVVRTGSGGRRDETGYAADYFRMELDFIRSGKLPGTYLSAHVRHPAATIASGK